MRLLLFALVISSLPLLAVKLFTYEFYLLDDPTCGIALRAEPMLESRMPLHRAPGMHTDYILVQDENEFIGAGIYRFTVQIGWILVPLSAVVVAALLRRCHGKQR